MHDVQCAPPRARRARGLPRKRARRLLLLSRGGPVHIRGGPVPVRRQQLRHVPRVELRGLALARPRESAAPRARGRRGARETTEERRAREDFPAQTCIYTASPRGPPSLPGHVSSDLYGRTDKTCPVSTGGRTGGEWHGRTAPRASPRVPRPAPTRAARALAPPARRPGGGSRVPRPAGGAGPPQGRQQQRKTAGPPQEQMAGPRQNLPQRVPCGAPRVRAARKRLGPYSRPIQLLPLPRALRRRAPHFQLGK